MGVFSRRGRVDSTVRQSSGLQGFLACPGVGNWPTGEQKGTACLGCNAHAAAECVDPQSGGPGTWAHRLQNGFSGSSPERNEKYPSQVGHVWVHSCPLNSAVWGASWGFLFLVPSGLHSPHMTGWFMGQRSVFSSDNIQGASCVALAPYVLFSALAGCLVSGLAVAGVGGCGCRRVFIFGGNGWSLAGLLAA